MGAEALLPMLDALALNGYPRALSAEEQATLRLGLLEAVDNLGDPRGLPVLRGVFATAVERRSCAPRPPGSPGSARTPTARRL